MKDNQGMEEGGRRYRERSESHNRRTLETSINKIYGLLGGFGPISDRQCVRDVTPKVSFASEACGTAEREREREAGSTEEIACPRGARFYTC